MAIKLQPPYVMCAMFCRLVGPAKDPTGIAEFITKLVITLAEAGSKASAVIDLDVLPPLYVMLAQGGVVGERSVSVIHRPPAGPALPKLPATGRMFAGLCTIGVVFKYTGRSELAAGMHLFEIVFDGRVITQVPLVLQFGAGLLH
jgi:hypothetical protein